jgi:hypothetical protein
MWWRRVRTRSLRSDAKATPGEMFRLATSLTGRLFRDSGEWHERNGEMGSQRYDGH